MKKFLITLAISTVFILGIWIIPEITNQNYSKDYSKDYSETYEEPYEMILEQDTVARNFIQPQYPNLQEEIITASAAPIDWQGIITWIIGSLNGVFGLIIMIKKVFGKTKP